MIGKVSKQGMRAQSAMEYLMTYGWAILVIAVVFAALFALNIFNLSGVSGVSCTVTSSATYVCQQPSIQTNSLFSLTFGQNTGQTIYNAILSVAPQSSALNTLGFPSTVSRSTVSINSLAPGVTTVVGVVLSSNVLPANTLQTPFQGTLWLNYSTTSGGVASSALQIGTINMKVT
ncbi:MAG: hypothetical protein KGH60_02180 [Candidatus Micrarchaeota archaeon]|nr:hypothetical protein [Candidatus Micrarchaeota archaeon]